MWYYDEEPTALQYAVTFLFLVVVVATIFPAVQTPDVRLPSKRFQGRFVKGLVVLAILQVTGGLTLLGFQIRHSELLGNGRFEMAAGALYIGPAITIFGARVMAKLKTDR